VSFRVVLLTENTFHACYLVSRWSREFGAGVPVVLRAEEPLPGVRQARDDFHRQYFGTRVLDDDVARVRFHEVYPDASRADRAMVELYGVPELSTTSGRPHYLGRGLNTERARTWLDGLTSAAPAPFLMVFLDRILAPWWISALDGRVINSHSAVLPTARGTFAVEQIAATEDTQWFLNSVGATVHYVDDGIDTGPIVQTRSLGDPWRFDSIWQVKAGCFSTAFDLLAETAKNIVRDGRAPRGGAAQPVLPGQDDFKRRDFDADRQRRAESGFDRMRLVYAPAAYAGPM
jgi:phosphoribosylglycinamide formyltransferase-1